MYGDRRLRRLIIAGDRAYLATPNRHSRQWIVRPTGGGPVVCYGSGLANCLKQVVASIGPIASITILRPSPARDDAGGDCDITLSGAE